MYPKSSWAFSQEVSELFDKHVRQSIPVYELIQSSIINLSDYFVSEGGIIYDLGCATGETIYHIHERHLQKQLRFVGVDSSHDMIYKAKEKLAQLKGTSVHFEHFRLEHFEFKEQSNFILAVLTMQFLPIHVRKQLLYNIHEALYEGGAFIFVEKTLAGSPLLQHMYTHIHYDMKQKAGLSHKEILQKEESLRGVMTPLSVQDNIKLLESVGFATDIFFKHGQFTGFIAIKQP